MMSLGYYIQALLSLAAVMGILYAFLKLTKSYHAKQYRGEMKIIDRITLDQGVSLMIVEVRNRHLLMSVAGKQLNLLERLDDEKV